MRRALFAVVLSLCAASCIDSPPAATPPLDAPRSAVPDTARGPEPMSITRNTSGLLGRSIAGDPDDPIALSDFEAQAGAASLALASDGLVGDADVLDHRATGTTTWSSVRYTKTGSRTKRMVQTVQRKLGGSGTRWITSGAHFASGGSANTRTVIAHSVTRSPDLTGVGELAASAFTTHSGWTEVTAKARSTYYRTSLFVDGLSAVGYDFDADATVPHTGTEYSSGWAGIGTFNTDATYLAEIWDCADRYLTIDGLGSGDKAQVLDADGTVLAEATESGGTATIDMLPVALSEVDRLVVTDSADVILDRFSGVVCGGDDFSWDGVSGSAVLVDAATDEAGEVIRLTFDRDKADPSGEHGAFSFSEDGGSARDFTAAALADGDDATIVLTVDGDPVTAGLPLTVSYTPGTVESAGGGSLDAIDDEPVTNRVDTQPFVTDGANWPWFGNVTDANAIYVPSTDRTWFASEAWLNDQREIRVTYYDHTAEQWGAEVTVGTSPLTDDAHGAPALFRDADGHIHAFFGSHASLFRHSSTTAPDTHTWATRTSQSGNWTYPNPRLIGSTLYKLIRGRPEISRHELRLLESTDITDGVISWASHKSIVNFGSNSRVYPGSVRVVGSEIHVVANWSNGGATNWQHVYYFIYDTADGSLSNFDGSEVVAAGSLPLNLADANADFRLFEHGSGQQGFIPALEFDTAGNPHVLFCDGLGTAFAVKHIWHNGTSWSSPETIGNTSSNRNRMTLVQHPSGVMRAYWTEAEGGAFTFGGHVKMRERASGGTWGPEHVVREADAHALDVPIAIPGAHADARVIFAEVTQGETDAEAGELQGWALGDSGYLERSDLPTDTHGPSSTIAANQWRSSIDDSTNLHVPLADDTDANWARSGANPESDAALSGFDPITDPGIDTGHVLRYRYSKDAADGRSIDLTVRIAAGDQVVATQHHADIPDTVTLGEIELTQQQVQAFRLAGGYGALRVELVSDHAGGGGSRRARVYYLEFEVPQTPTPATITLGAAAGMEGIGLGSIHRPTSFAAGAIASGSSSSGPTSRRQIPAESQTEGPPAASAELARRPSAVAPMDGSADASPQAARRTGAEAAAETAVGISPVALVLVQVAGEAVTDGGADAAPVVRRSTSVEAVAEVDAATGARTRVQLQVEAPSDSDLDLAVGVARAAAAEAIAEGLTSAHLILERIEASIIRRIGPRVTVSLMPTRHVQSDMPPRTTYARQERD